MPNASYGALAQPREASRLPLAATLLVALTLAGSVPLIAAEPGNTSGAGFGNDEALAVPAEKAPALWKHIELKRQWTERGTPEEGSKTTLRLEVTPQSFISLVRIDLPFVDKKNGDPMSPHLGDLKLKFASLSI